MASRDEESNEDSIIEETLLQQSHWYRERNRNLVKRIKDQEQKRFGKLSYEVCNFSFVEFYNSKIGEGVID